MEMLAGSLPPEARRRTAVPGSWMEVCIGNVVINRSFFCCLVFSFLCLWTSAISWSHNQEKVVAPWGCPATFQHSGRWTHSLATVCCPCYLNDCARGASLCMANTAPGPFWGKGRQPRTESLSPGAKWMVLEEPGRKDGFCSAPWGCFRFPRIPLSPEKEQWSADTQRSWL